jgi:tetratricopeptide (TPR) repeat protein
MDGYICRPFFIAFFIYFLVYPQLTLAQFDPVAAQQQAIRRIDKAVEVLRKTGDRSDSELAQANIELMMSNTFFLLTENWSALALGQIKEGSIQRMRGNFAQANELYRRAGEAARRAGNVAYQADALAWSALAEKSKKVHERKKKYDEEKTIQPLDLGQAMTDATQAVRFAETSGDEDVLARALNVLGTIQILQEDFKGAAATISREVSVAMRAKDPIAAYYAYLNRSDLYFKVGVELAVQRRDFKRSYQAFDRARDDLQQARGIALNQHFLALARNPEESIEEMDKARAKFKEWEQKLGSMQGYMK